MTTDALQTVWLSLNNQKKNEWTKVKKHKKFFGNNVLVSFHYALLCVVLSHNIIIKFTALCGCGSKMCIYLKDINAFARHCVFHTRVKIMKKNSLHKIAFRCFNTYISCRDFYPCVWDYMLFMYAVRFSARKRRLLARNGSRVPSTTG